MRVAARLIPAVALIALALGLPLAANAGTLIPTTTSISLAASRGAAPGFIDFSITLLPTSGGGSIAPGGDWSVSDPSFHIVGFGSYNSLTNGDLVPPVHITAPGTYTIYASYPGDATYGPSSDSVTFTALPTPTVTVTSSANPSLLGGPVTFTATLTGGNAPTGGIGFSDGSTPLGSSNVDTNGTATFSVPGLVAGPHTITASYTGDVNNAPSTGTLTQNVAIPTTTTIALDTASGPAPGFINFSITLLPTSGGGSITQDGGTWSVTDSSGNPLDFGTFNSQTNGSPVFPVHVTTPGTYTVRASYPGDATYGPSTDTATFTAVPVPVLTVSSSQNPSLLGSPVTFSAFLAGGNSPTGTVSFADGGTSLGSSAVDSTGRATLTTSTLSAGPHSIVASYSGDASNAPSTGGITQNVLIPTTTTIALDTPSGPAPGFINFSITLVPTSGGGSITQDIGTWSVTDGLGNLVDFGTFNSQTNGAPVFPVHISTPGTYTIYATYPGDSTYGPSTDTAKFVAVPVPVLSVSSSKNPTLLGDPVTFSAFLAGGNSPTGTVTFADGGTTLGSSAVDSTGRATLTTSALTAGPHSIVASYSGDAGNAPSTGAMTENVAIPTTTTINLLSPTGPAPGFINFSLTLVPNSGAGSVVPGGNWSVTDSGGHLVDFGSYNGATNGDFVLPVHVTAPGTYTVFATYPGNSTYGPSSDTATFTAFAPAASVGLSSSENPTTAGRSVTFTANVGGNVGTPTGSVTFSDGTTALGTGTLDGSGVATFTTAALGVGSHGVSASYSGDSVYGAATSPMLSETVYSPAPPSTAASVAPSANGAGWFDAAPQVTLTATASADGAPVAATYYAIDDATCAAGAVATCHTYTGPFAVSGDGVHTVTFFSADSFGDAEAVHSLTLKVDTTAPLTIANPSTQPNGAGWYSGPVSVSLSATDATSGVAETDASLDGAAFAPVSGPVSIRGDGIHALQYRSIDAAGNVETTHSLSVRIDGAAPTLSVAVLPGTPAARLPVYTVTGTATFSSTAGQRLGATPVTCFDTTGLRLALTGTDTLSGPASISYAATGSQPIATQVVPGATATVAITRAGFTQLTASAADLAGNASTAQRWLVLVAPGPFSCALPAPTFALPRHGSIAVVGTITSAGGTRSFSIVLPY